MSKSPRRVFISRVTRELGSYAEELRNALQSVEIVARTQLTFRQEPDTDTTLEKLSKYIHDSDVVLCLLGTYSGGYPPTSDLDRPIYPPARSNRPEKTWKDLLPEEFDNLSYTQWEYILARYWGKSSFLYHAVNHQSDAESHNPEIDNIPQQKLFLEYITGILGNDRQAFSNQDKLCRDALCSLWPIDTRDDSVEKVLNNYNEKLDNLTTGQKKIIDKQKQTEIDQKKSYIRLILFGVFSAIILSSIILINFKTNKKAIQEQQISNYIPLVLDKYNQKFISLRESEFPANQYPDEFVSNIVKESLAEETGLSISTINVIVDSLEKDQKYVENLKINQRVTAHFITGRYKLAIALGSNSKEELNALGYQSLTYSYLELFEKEPNIELLEKAIIYAKVQSQISSPEKDVEKWTDDQCTLAECYLRIDNNTEAEKLLFKVKKILAKREKPLLIARVNLMIANNLSSVTGYKKTLDLLEVAYDNRRKILGKKNEYTIFCRTSLAQFLMTNANWKLAKEVNSACYDILLDTYGESYLPTIQARSRSALIDFFQSQDNINFTKDAKIKIEKEVQYLEEKIGPRHPLTLRSKSTLLAISSRLEKNNSLVTKYETLLSEYKHVFGENHISVINLKTTGAHLLDNKTEQKKQDGLLEEIYSDLVKIRGKFHPRTFNAKMSIVLHISRKGNTASEVIKYKQKSIEMLKEMLKDANRELGTQHLVSIDIESTLASILSESQLSGSAAEAQRHWKSALDNAISKYNLSNDITYKIINNYSLFLKNYALQTGDMNMLLVITEELGKFYIDSQNFFGFKNSKTLAAGNSYCRALQATKKHSNLEKANKTYEEMHDLGKTFLTENNYKLLTLKNNLALTHQDLGRYIEAIKLFKEVYETNLKYLGKNNPDTIISLANYAGGLKFTQGTNRRANLNLASDFINKAISLAKVNMAHKVDYLNQLKLEKSIIEGFIAVMSNKQSQIDSSKIPSVTETLLFRDIHTNLTKRGFVKKQNAQLNKHMTYSNPKFSKKEISISYTENSKISLSQIHLDILITQKDVQELNKAYLKIDKNISFVAANGILICRLKFEKTSQNNWLDVYDSFNYFVNILDKTLVSK